MRAMYGKLYVITDERSWLSRSSGSLDSTTTIDSDDEVFWRLKKNIAKSK